MKRTVTEHQGRRWLSVGIIAFIALVGNAATAQTNPSTDTSFAVQLLRPSPGPNNFVSVESPELGPDMKPSVGLFLAYEHRPFVLLSCGPSNNCKDGGKTINAVNNLLSLDLLGSFSFLKYFQAGLAVPITLWQHGQGFQDGGNALIPGDEYNAFSFGDLRVHLKARFIGKDGEDGPSLAVAVIPSLPIAAWTGLGTQTNTSVDGPGAHGYGGSGFLTVTAPKVLFGYRIKALRLGVTGDVLWQKKVKLFSAEIGHTLNFSAAAGYLIIPEVEIIAELYGHKSLVSQNFTDTESAALVGQLGARFNIKDVFFQLAGGGGIISGIGVPQFQIIGGAGWAPKPEKRALIEESQITEWDRDGDGVDNDHDACPDQPEDKDSFQDEDGCPDTDNDKDGVQDGYDSCPLEPEDKDSFRDDDGCPDLDHDEDGIKVPEDKCPDKAEDFDGFEDTDGCWEDDNDKDGIPDASDTCPNDGEDKDSFEDTDGCPENDNDGDGVPDAQDKCPNEPETLNGNRDNDGCPDKGKVLVVVTEEKIEIKDTILFENAEANIKGKQSFLILDIVANVLLGDKTLRVSIEGHTDDKGNAPNNRDLSKRRAESVKTYLVSKRVMAERLDTAGFGPDKPIGDNKTADGRAMNRRVEFILIRPQKKEAAQTGGDETGGAMDFTSGETGGAAMDFTDGDDASKTDKKADKPTGEAPKDEGKGLDFTKGQ